MSLELSGQPLQGEVQILPSKSQLHRLLICAALSEEESLLETAHTQAEDILATTDCLEALGASITAVPAGYRVHPIQRKNLPKKAQLPCRESGSTLRFFLPLVCALGVETEFLLAGRLPARPLAPLDALLMKQGCILSRPSPNTLHCRGQLQAGLFSIPANISSQYITGLLFALPLLSKASQLQLTGKIESADYIEMTLDALAVFGVNCPYDASAQSYAISPQTCHSPETVFVEGDWSNAAFWLTAGAFSGGSIRCHGLNPESKQGDRAIVDILKRVGAEVTWKNHCLCIDSKERRGFSLDVSAVPDLVPILAGLASICQGESHLYNAHRLRLKESDRLHSVTQTLQTLGGDITEGEDDLRIWGKPSLVGGKVDSWNDHRIAMLVGIVSSVCPQGVTLTGADAVRKSYPNFWEILARLGTRHKEVLP